MGTLHFYARATKKYVVSPRVPTQESAGNCKSTEIEFVEIEWHRTMMAFFQLLPDFPFDENEEPWFVDFPGITSVQGYWFVEGSPLPNWINEVKGTCPNGNDCSRDFMLAKNGWPLFSLKFQQCIVERFIDSIQFLPISFSPRLASSVNTDFSIGQILVRLDAIDRTRTKVDNDDWTPRVNGTLRVQYPICLKTNVIRDSPIFRIVGSPVQIYVREDFRDAIEKCGLTGIRFDSNVPLS